MNDSIYTVNIDLSQDCPKPTDPDYEALLEIAKKFNLAFRVDKEHIGHNKEAE
jgi:hypothetical protein